MSNTTAFTRAMSRLTMCSPRPAPFARGGHAEALQQVRGPVVAQRARVAHRPDEHDGARVAHGEVQEIGDLLEGVGAAGDNDAGQSGVGGERLVVVAAAGRVAPAEAADVDGDLIALPELKRLMQEDTIAMAFSIMNGRWS